MKRRKNNRNQLYYTRKVSHIINEHQHEIELETIRYSNQFYVIATICQDKPPYLDCMGKGKDHNEREAMRLALKELYGRAYKTRG
ncbi:hypothetical protein A9C19_01190 [Bacillus weihaiensis]|uniref:Uncharacterized protein n=1 Tax=Bacillus weihaiensis TaxID=1547283 RepID=A0A1L3MM98_9BACI|nr:hypothetical protein A9C19_01190 [Bacillus weihaiensis]